MLIMREYPEILLRGKYVHRLELQLVSNMTLYVGSVHYFVYVVPGLLARVCGT